MENNTLRKKAKFNVYTREHTTSTIITIGCNFAEQILATCYLSKLQAY